MALASLTKAAGYYTVVDFATKAVQAASVLILANVFSKIDFGLFSILFAVMQLTSVFILGGVVECAIPLLVPKSDTGDSLTRGALGKAFSIVAVRLVILIPIAVGVAVLLDVAEYQANLLSGWGWITIYSLAGILNGCTNIYIGILTCAGEHQKSIYFRAILVITQSALRLALSMYFNEINYYGISMLLVPVLLTWKLVSKNYSSGISSIHNYQGGAVSCFFVNSIVNWFPWYGLTLMVGILLGKNTAAEYALITNIASVMLLAAGGFSQAFISVQIRSNSSTINKKIGEVIALQAIILSVCAAILLVFYKLLLYFSFIGSGYGDLQIKLFISLISIVISSSYFITVPAYSLRGDGLTLVYISIFSITFAAIAGWIGYQLSEPYFPYIVFFVFFISRGLLVSAKSGYLWGEVLKNNLRILMVSILSVVLLIFGVIGLS